MRISAFGILLLFLIPVFSIAQVYTIDIDRSNQDKTSSYTNNRIESTHLSLPFWDDFSWTGFTPSDSLWLNSYNVEISAGSGANPPTYNVAKFDGVQINGEPYSINFADFESGDTDTLTSQPIDLSSYSPSDNIYFSFFYQKQGNGEFPDDEDGLRVEFLSLIDTVYSWKPGIAPGIITGANVTDTDFHPAIVEVVGETDFPDEFYHENFQFRIISTGRKTGPFDTWNVDYVYLNSNRSPGDIQFNDHSFNSPINSPLITYTSIPISHFKGINPNSIDTIRSSVFNLGSEGQPISAYARSKVRYLDTLISYDTLEFYSYDDSLQNNLLTQVQPFTSKTAIAKSAHDLSALTETTSYVEFDISLILNSGDVANGTGFNANAFLINDYLSNKFYLKDYYAYDDGSAEKGAGVNGEGDQLAYQFNNFIEPSDSSWLQGVDVYFPPTVNFNQAGTQIKFKVWEDSLGQPGKVLYSKFFLIPKADTLNEFYRFKLENTAIPVPATFYVGWEQLSSEKVFIGLDKNTNTAHKIWVNSGGEWHENNNQIVGSLMIRPFFTNVARLNNPANDIYTSTIEQVRDVKVYPNPSDRYFRIEKLVSTSITIFNQLGEQIEVPTTREHNATVLDFDSFPNGMYLLKFVDNSYIRTERIILNR